MLHIKGSIKLYQLIFNQKNKLIKFVRFMLNKKFVYVLNYSTICKAVHKNNL